MPSERLHPSTQKDRNSSETQQEPKGAKDITTQTGSAIVLASRGATASMQIRAKYIQSRGIRAVPSIYACLHNELSDLRGIAVPKASSRLSSWSTGNHSGSGSYSTRSSRSGVTSEAEEDGIACSSASSTCSDNRSEDVDTWPGRCCKACFSRGLSLWPLLQQPPKSQTITIFDWDDTLLCTSVLSHASDGYDSGYLAVAKRLLPDLARAATDLLEAACRLGPTFIITNAVEGWVEYSAQRWVPTLLPALGKVTEIISARSRYEWQNPDVGYWKLQAFLELQSCLDQRPVTNLIAVGDSAYEMDAACAMANQFPRAVVKTVKFKPTPMPLELLKELELVREKLDRIVEAGRNLQIKVFRNPPRKPREADANS